VRPPLQRLGGAGKSQAMVPDFIDIHNNPPGIEIIGRRIGGLRSWQWKLVSLEL
jgi:hypothetical protein